ncbi:hypothetical protein INT44_009232 [Umbelopsis vinacea]|uniref:Uncharacterized protein n=1 Tax=Umbelopsis vinacea TaxID=44442 RepID=A0A8H7Q1J1_9FUNG|nr:hypothetical protein INT44_009232 [Umbelopsis vinacea]
MKFRSLLESNIWLHVDCIASSRTLLGEHTLMIQLRRHGIKFRFLSEPPSVSLYKKFSAPQSTDLNTICSKKESILIKDDSDDELEL